MKSALRRDSTVCRCRGGRRTGLSVAEPAEIDTIALHLQRVHRRLSSAESTGRFGAERARGIAELQRYIGAGIFPRNRGGGAVDRTVAVPWGFPWQHGRSPVFIDEAGRTCAVAAIMLASGATALASRVRVAANRSWLAEMSTPGLREWVEQSGFTLEELAMIQPTYDDSTTLSADGLVCYFEVDDRTLGGLLSTRMTRAELEKFVAHSEACVALAGVGDGGPEAVPRIRQLSGSPGLTTEAALARLATHFERRASQGQIFLREGKFIVEPDGSRGPSAGRPSDGTADIAAAAAPSTNAMAKATTPAAPHSANSVGWAYPLAGLPVGALLVALWAVRRFTRLGQPD